MDEIFLFLIVMLLLWERLENSAHVYQLKQKFISWQKRRRK